MDTLTALVCGSVITGLLHVAAKESRRSRQAENRAEHLQAENDQHRFLTTNRLKNHYHSAIKLSMN